MVTIVEAGLRITLPIFPEYFYQNPPNTVPSETNQFPMATIVGAGLGITLPNLPEYSSQNPPKAVPG